MTKNLGLVALFAFGLTVLPGSPLVTVAAAWQCAELTEYVEMWDDSEELNDTLGLYARGVADAGGEPCGVTVRTYIKGPDGTELASAFGYGSGSASSTVVVYLDESSAEGNYEGQTEGWSQGVHYGCSFKLVGLSIVTANYIKSWEGETFCSYLRCEDGHCPQLTGKKSAFYGGVCTQYQRISSLRMNFGLFATCTAKSPWPISSCQGKESVSGRGLERSATFGTLPVTGRHRGTTRAIDGPARIRRCGALCVQRTDLSIGSADAKRPLRNHHERSAALH